MKKKAKPECFKFKATYTETYKKGCFVYPESLPKEPLPHMHPDCKITRIEMLNAGVGEMDGKRVEFQTLKIFCETEAKP